MIENRKSTALLGQAKVVDSDAEQAQSRSLASISLPGPAGDLVTRRRPARAAPVAAIMATVHEILGSGGLGYGEFLQRLSASLPVSASDADAWSIAPAPGRPGPAAAGRAIMMARA
jgi:hypothetical protein